MRNCGNERRIFQLWTIDARDVFQPAQREVTFHPQNIFAVDLQIVQQDLQQQRRHADADAQANYVAKLPLPQTFFRSFQKIAGFQLLDLDVSIARHVERMRIENVHAWEERTQVGGDQSLPAR